MSDEYSPLWRQRTLVYSHPQHYGYFYAVWHKINSPDLQHIKGGNCIINIKEQLCRNL